MCNRLRTQRSGDRRLAAGARTMSRRILVLLLELGLLGCSTRDVVVKPEEVPKLDDSQ